MHSSTEPTPTSAAYQYQSAKLSGPAPASYAFLSTPPKHKHKPQPISTRCSPSRSLPRTVSSRRRSSISGSPAFQTSFITLAPTPTSETSKTPQFTTHGYTAAFAIFPRRGSVPHVQEAPINQARRVPASPKRTSLRFAPSSPKRGSPQRRHHRVPSSPFASPSPTRTRPCAGSTTRIHLPKLPPPPPTRTSKLSKIRSLTNLRARSPSPAPPSRAMATPASTTPQAAGKRAKRSATPARGSAALAKYRPMPFIQQMQMIQFLEGGSLDSHIRRHHVHGGQGTAHTGFATSGKEENAHAYAFTDERGMVWFDEEEEWEFTCLLPRTRPQRHRGIRRLLGKRCDDVSGDEWEDFREEGEELEKDVDPEVLLARDDDDLRAREDDLASFGGALEGAWARDHSNQSVLKLPPSKMDRKRKRARLVSSIPVPQPAPIPATTRDPRERVATLKEEFFATAFTPSPARTTTSSPIQAPRAPSPFRMFTRVTTSMDDNTSRTLFQRHHRAARSVPNASGAPVGQSFASFGTSLRGGDVLDAKEILPIPQSPTVQWADVEDEPLACVSLPPATETRHRAPSPSSNPEPRLKTVSPPPAAARRLGIEPSTAVSLQPFADLTRKQTFRSIKGFKSARGN
ncbi:hypothetical protein JB92DRAFT_3148900 [Gautieria morchelliformis]|nr:hypothetical protein JB92DRAFT_3148900 [Gautieria morchelliformis]